MVEDSEPASDPSTPALAHPSPPMTHPPSGPGKRRAASLPDPALPPAQKQPPSADPFATPSGPLATLPASRRRRFILYSVAFATMLAMSSVLDVRRAAFKHRQSKVQLSLPSASSLSSLSNVDDPNDPASDPVSAADLGPASAHDRPSISLRPGAAPPPEAPRKNHGPSAPTVSSEKHAPTEQDPPALKGDPVLSEQELKDDVDQLIAHVDQEEQGSTANDTAPASAAPSEPDSAVPPAAEEKQELAVPVPKPVQKIANTFLGLGGESSTATPTPDPTRTVNGTLIGADGTEVRLNSEESFTSSQKRLQTLLADDKVKGFIDENDLRALEALALQATRGDCEHKSGAEGGSLFKTDAEAASNVDIERTDPLWGAWCLFMGSYKTDAMRDYVTKQKVVEEKMLVAKGDAEANKTVKAVAFDPNAASLDDVMTPEQQSALREKMDTIASHLREYDVRYLAALSLQATFGDCGPYGKEAEVTAKDSEQTAELRKLVEGLLDQTVVRREGAQWGAWCVLQGKKRTSAASELSQRVDLLINQLSKSQAAIHSGVPDGDIPQSDGLSVKTADSATRSQEHVAR